MGLEIYRYVKTRRRRFTDFIVKCLNPRTFRFIGFSLIMGTLIYHFDLRLTAAESTLIGVGIGFLI